MRLSAFLLVFVTAQAAVAAELPRSTPLPGGFVDSTGQIGIFNTPDGGIQAVELGAGKSFWQSNQAQRPLLVIDNRLFALAAVTAPVHRCFGFEWRSPDDGPRSGFRLVAFDLAQFGSVVLESETVALPDWASLVETHERAFALRWSLDNGRLLVTWEASAWYAGPTRKTPQEAAAYSHHAAAAVRFDLETGAFEAVPPQPAPAAPPLFDAGRELERRAVRWQKTLGPQHFVLTLEDKQGRQTLWLHTFDVATRQRRDSKILLTGHRLTVLPTLDEHYLCVRDQSPSPDLEGKKDQQAVQWSIFAVDGGRSVAEVPFEPGTIAATVDGGRVYFLVTHRFYGTMDRPFVVPRSLRAVDLKTGMTLWDLPVGGKPSAPPPLIAWPVKSVPTR